MDVDKADIMPMEVDTAGTKRQAEAKAMEVDTAGTNDTPTRTQE